MAGRPKCEPEVLANLAALEAVIPNSESKVIIVDVHKNWCGPAIAIMSFMNQIWSDYDDANSRIGFHTISIESTPDMVKKIQTYVAAAHSDVKVANHGCKPLFIVFRKGECVGVVDGLNTPELSSLVSLHIPKMKAKEDKNTF